VYYVFITCAERVRLQSMQRASAVLKNPLAIVFARWQ